MQRNDFLAHLADRQADGSAPISVTIGHVDSHAVRHDSVTITEGPPAIFSLVALLVDRGLIPSFDVHMTPQGLRIGGLE